MMRPPGASTAAGKTVAVFFMMCQGIVEIHPAGRNGCPPPDLADARRAGSASLMEGLTALKGLQQAASIGDATDWPRPLPPRNAVILS